MYDILWQLLLQVLLIGLNAVFACAEIAVLSVSETKLERMAADGNRKAARLRKLTVQPARFLATIQVAITLSGFLGSAFAADNFSELWFNGLWVWGWGFRQDPGHHFGDFDHHYFVLLYLGVRRAGA